MRIQTLRCVIVCGLVILFLIIPGRVASETIGDGKGVQCIPDVQFAMAALAKRRGAQFIAYLHQTGDKYLRNSDYRCLYDMLRPFEHSTLSIREAKYLLLYRMMAQLGQQNTIGAHITSGWLSELRRGGKDHEFDMLMENKLKKICAGPVRKFKNDIARYKYSTTLAQIDGSQDQQNRWRDSIWAPIANITSWKLFSSLDLDKSILSYLVTFASQRMARWDYLTLKRCFDALNVHDLNPEERLYLLSIQVVTNLNLGFSAEAYDAYMRYNALAAVHSGAIISEQRVDAAEEALFADKMTRFYVITREKMEMAVEEICRYPVANDRSLPQIVASVAELEAKAVAGIENTGEWLCAKKALENVIDPDAFYSTISENMVRPLFLLVQANMKVKDYKTAYRQLVGLRMSGNIKKSPYAEPIEKMFDESARMIRESHAETLKEKLTDMTEIFYLTARNRFAGVTLTAFLLTFFFYQWHLQFKRHTSGSMSLVEILGRIPLFKEPSIKVLSWLDDNRGQKLFRSPVFREEDINLKDRRQIERLADEFPGGATIAGNVSHDMVRRLSFYAPYPITLIAQLPGYQPQRHFWYYMACGGFLSMIATWVFAFGQPMKMQDKATLFFLLTATIVAALTGIRIMARQMLKCLREIATMLENHSDLQKVETGALVMFRDPWQFFVAFVVYGLFFTVSKNQLPSSHIVVILIILIMAPIHWMMISSLLFTRTLCNMQNLSINPLSPLKTWGLQKWIAVIGTFATTGSIIITFGAAIPIITNWENLTGRDLFWVCAMLPLLLAYWVYPYFRIRELVRRFKLARMHFIKKHISEAYDNWQLLTADAAAIKNDNAAKLEAVEKQMDRLNQYYQLFKVIDKSPEFFVDIYSVMELAKVMGFPSLFAMMVSLLRFL